ncbi:MULTISPECIES: hypothetical protein [Streptomyces]|uniref:Uncharacterized protein n=1 Tax=Streptomyces spinosisporus TaxID=2927582 RepID=A0ABS9XF46_9ACTN|nr:MULTISPECIES: hypothetical protein [Streptomyces]MCI3240633.1 hypothetical protein [Streptomyces spinosisporus]WUB37208.1 hypothetical protein OHN38_20775 [Streptomyces sp. NBC_00588]
MERTLDEAMSLGPIAEAIDRCGGAVSREGLRAKALGARTAIAASVDAEYRAYLEALAMDSSLSPDGEASTARGAGRWSLRSPAVLFPGLPAVAGLLFLLPGCGLRVFGGRPYVGDGLITAGLLLCAVAVGALVGDLIWLSVTKARTRSMGAGDVGREVARARKAWELALMERGMVPFLLDCIEEADQEERGDRAAR